MHGVGDEKHLVFECSALNGICLRFPNLFTGFHTMSSFMNQAAQRDVMHFITDCLRTHTAMTILSRGWFQLLNLRCFPIPPLLRSP